MENSIEEFKIEGHKMVALWAPNILWTRSNKRGLAYFEDGRWAFIEIGFNNSIAFSPQLFTKEQLTSNDIEWDTAFNKIENGLVPSILNIACSCGAHTLYGKSWTSHTPMCAINQKDSWSLGPKNNDGRSTCFKCSGPTVEKPCWNNVSHLCTNPKCPWYMR